MKMKTILTIGLCLFLGAALVGAALAGAGAVDTESTAPYTGGAPAASEKPSSPEEAPPLVEPSPSEESAVTASPEPESEPAAAHYEFPEGSMSLVLPGGWEYEVQTKEMKAREDGLVLCAIDFWPSAHPEMRLELGYWPDRIGMCGTGVTIEHIDLGGDLSAWRYTETIDGTLWLTLIYDHVGEQPCSFVLRGDIDGTLWQQYEAEIMDIAATAVMTVTETIVD